MKTGNKWSALFLLLVASAATALAQTPTASPSPEPLPPGPWPARAPDMAAWTVTLTLRPAGSGALNTPDKKLVSLNKTVTKTGKVLKTGTIMKMGNVYAEEMTDPTGKKWKTWASDGVLITFWPTLGKFLPGGFDGGFTKADYTKGDFAEVNWLDASSYVGTAQYGGNKCYVFTKKASVFVSFQAPTDTNQPSMEPTPPPIMRDETWKAYLDAKTLLPLVVQKGNLVYTYAYLPTPQDPLDIPLEVQKEIDKRTAKPVAAPVPKAF